MESEESGWWVYSCGEDLCWAAGKGSREKGERCKVFGGVGLVVGAASVEEQLIFRQSRLIRSKGVILMNSS